MAKQNSRLIKVCLDVVCCAIVGFPLLIFYVAGKPFIRGFYCDDDSIRYPFVKDTISNMWLYVIGITSPVIVISVTETIICVKKIECQNKNQFSVHKFQIPPLAVLLYKQIGVFLFGACVSQILTDIAKYTTGRLRPYFIAMCRPDVNLTSCSQYGYRYVENFNCTNPDLFAVREARLSFPSGHASFSSYAMVYIIIYLQHRMKFEYNKLLKPFLQFLALATTWFISLSRISDYKHHWSDVLVGGILGTSVAIIVIKYVSNLPIKLFAYEKYPLSSPSSTQLSNYNSCDKDVEEGMS
ncbi:putative phosphatidate phosphatase [Centruroides vittatus]|uniref:putative phosphatidate phosphatase n=1 Tax=Centruroides vittatus TaxID=120091 RepID=UPI003510BD49